MNLSISKVFNLALIFLCIFLLALLTIRGCRECPPNTEHTTHVIHDTIQTNAQPFIIKVPAPFPKYVRKMKEEEGLTLIIEDSNYDSHNSAYPEAQDHIRSKASCSDTAFYIDTITSKDNWKLVLAETIANNRIIERTPTIQDLRPVITTTIIKQPTPTKDHIRFYAGMDVSINANQANRWSIGPGGLLAIPQGYAFRYGYDLRNNSHTAGVYILFRKKM